MNQAAPSRRIFLGASLVFGAGAVFWFNNRGKKTRLYANETQVLLHTAYHLFTHSNIGPGAKDFHISSYLASVLEDKRILKSDRDYFLRGAFWLEESSFDKYNASFLNLSHENRENILQAIILNPWGRNFVYTCLGYIFEALLSAPIYGSNINDMGWKWLEHKPGFPQPQSIQEITYEV